MTKTQEGWLEHYDAVCTPDFFGYNSNLELQYREDEFRELNNKVRPRVRVENSPK